MDSTLELLRDLSESFGPPGFEGDVANIMIKKLGSITQVKRDNLGGAIFEKEGKSQSPRIMLEAHMDEIGFMVKEITETGYVKLIQLGTWSPECVLGQEVVVRCKKGDIAGILANIPYHVAFIRKPTLDSKRLIEEVLFNLYVDIGAESREDVTKEFGICPGDPVVPKPYFSITENKDLYVGKAWDDRVGVGLVIGLLELLNKEEHPNIIYGVGSTQEEITPNSWRGVKPATELVRPDLAISLEIAPVHDAPWHSDRDTGIRLGKGPVIFAYESVMIPNPKLKEFVLKIAEKENIPFQVYVAEEVGSDAKVIHLYHQGVPTITIGVPARYVHTCHGIISRKDFDSTLQLLLVLSQKMTRSVYENILSYT